MTWAYGVVGMVQLATHWWSTSPHRAGHRLVDQLTDLGQAASAALLPPREPEDRPAAEVRRAPGSS